jgi:hypothetical protein
MEEARGPMRQRITREGAIYEACESFLTDELGPTQVGTIGGRPMYLSSSRNMIYFAIFYDNLGKLSCVVRQGVTGRLSQDVRT